ncbi:hypothetical protein GCM10023171_09580 [Microbacterium panaciterrae]|uniref:Peptidase inhibitor family I36 n=2 Tax=Microbacterium panaciterrae TaxID=985759 RepID=A0ABP8P4F0_9MICO
MRSRWSSVAVSLTMFVLVGFGTTAGAGVQASGGASTPAPVSKETCWADLTTAQSLCVPTGTDLVTAVAETTGIRLVVPDGTVIGGVVSERSQLKTPTVATSTVTGILYDDINYGGGSFVASSSGTCSVGSYSFADLSPFGWNDRASSFRSYAGCSGAVYQNINFGGSTYGFVVNAPSLGSMNDQASSWRMQ